VQEGGSVSETLRTASSDGAASAYLARDQFMDGQLPATDGSERQRDDGERWRNLPRPGLKRGSYE